MNFNLFGLQWKCLKGFLFISNIIISWFYLSNFAKNPGKQSIYEKQINTVYCCIYLTLISFPQTHLLLSFSSALWHVFILIQKFGTINYWDRRAHPMLLLPYLETCLYFYPEIWVPSFCLNSWDQERANTNVGNPNSCLEEATSYRAIYTWLHSSDQQKKTTLLPPRVFQILEDCCACQGSLRLHMPTAIPPITWFLWIPLTQDFF